MGRRWEGAQRAWSVVDSRPCVEETPASVWGGVFSTLQGYPTVLREGEDLYRRLVEDAPEGMAYFDVQGRIEYANQALVDMLVGPGDDLRGQSLVSFLSDDAAPLISECFSRAVRGGCERVELQLRRHDGSTFWGLLALRAVTEYTGRVRGLSGVLCDISGRKLAEEQMQQLAYTDPLTGLPNRVLLRDRLEQALAAARREGAMVGVAFLDLDGFKQFNDTFGHAAGDTLLRTLADMLRHSLRRSDTVARLGGDEFVVILSGLHDLDDALASVRKLYRSLSAAPTSGPEAIDSACSLSIGVALFPQDGEEGDILLHRADQAMYQAKSKGGGNCHFFCAGLNDRPPMP